MGFRSWLRRRRQAKGARRLVAGLFRDPEILRRTSLRPHHASRWVLLDWVVDGDAVVQVRFGILRHPRPYAFSRQSHKVIEHYVYDARRRHLERLGGHNVTREAGRDADD